MQYPLKMVLRRHRGPCDIVDLNIRLQFLFYVINRLPKQPKRFHSLSSPFIIQSRRMAEGIPVRKCFVLSEKLAPTYGTVHRITLTANFKGIRFIPSVYPLATKNATRPS